MAFASRHWHLPPTAAETQELQRRMEREIRQHRNWLLFEGAVFLIFGSLAVILPGVTALSATLLIGALLVATGIFQFIANVRTSFHWWPILSSVLSLIVGGWMLFVPFAGVLAVVMAVAIFLAVEGVLEILLAFEFRPMRNWGWMLASGIASLILFTLLWTGFPTLSVYYLGLLIAVNFIFYGVSLLMLVASVPRTDTQGTKAA